MTQGPIRIGPAGPDPDEILQALRRALRDDPGARERARPRTCRGTSREAATCRMSPTPCW